MPTCTSTRNICALPAAIYKEGEKTRKIHHLICAPDFATADHISGRLLTRHQQARLRRKPEDRQLKLF
jgi:hypothetical protein